MKKLFCLFIIIHCSIFAYAGKDSVYVQIINDTVKVWNVGVEENCCIRVVTSTNISNDSIIVLEHDTATVYCLCTCTFDFSVSLTGLQPGTYHVFVYRQFTFFTPESLYFIGTTSFTYNGEITAVIKSTAYQSACYYPPIDAVKEPERLPIRTTLSQNYPNPFNPVTIIRYSLPVNCWVTLKIYNILGQEIATLVDEMQDAGFKSIEFSIDGINATRKQIVNLSSGVYIYKLMAGEFSQVRKMLLVK